MLLAKDWGPFQIYHTQNAKFKFFHTQNPKTFRSISTVTLPVHYRTSQKEQMMQALLKTSNALSQKQRSSVIKNIPSKSLWLSRAF
jgi:hypothetical protein